MIDLQKLNDEIEAALKELDAPMPVRSGPNPRDAMREAVRPIVDDVWNVVQKMFVYDAEVAHSDLFQPHDRYALEFATFTLLLHSVPRSPARALAFTVWVERSENTYAGAYRVGQGLGEFHSKPDTRRAAHGRRLIGASTREKVRLAADAHRHKSKETASFDIAESVQLSPGRVRKLLSEIFPGETWKKKL